MTARLCLFLLLLTILNGCQHTTYHRMGHEMEATQNPATLLDRRVTYRIDRAFYATAPDCAALRTRTPVPPRFRRMVERSVERHLATRLDRVIGPGRLRQVEADLGIDMSMASDRLVFARQVRCRALVEIILHEISDDYLVLWAQRGISVTLTMTRMADGKVLWTARHRASRGDGGLPLTLLSLPFSVARAARLKSDPELFASLTDDAVRRMMKTLPDSRSGNVAGALYR